MAPGRATVVVVGGGPAGSSAARTAAAAGLRTVVLERERMPRDKVCGEGLTPRAVRSLARIGLLPELRRQGQEVRRAHLVSPGGVELRAELPETVYGGELLTIPRTVLDARLLQEAARCGAEVREGARVQGIEHTGTAIRLRIQGSEPLEADIVIGCDGVHSLVRRSLGVGTPGPGRTAQAMRTIYEEVTLPDPGALMLVWDRALLPAYGWVFPLPGRRANVGIGIRADRLRARGGTLPGLFEQFLKTPTVRDALKNGRMMGRALGCPIPYSSSWGPCCFDRVLLAGDAAGLVNPLTGEGIDLAIESGELAGEAAVAAAERGDFARASLLGYERVCEATFGRLLRLNGWLGHAFAMPWLLDRIFRSGNRSDAMREQIAQVTLGGQRAAITARMVAEILRG